MTKVKRSQRRRAWAPKTQTGCATCRCAGRMLHNLTLVLSMADDDAVDVGRRIKCDETASNCLNCSKAGFQCDGCSRNRSPLAQDQDLVLSKQNPTAMPTFSLNETEIRAFRSFQTQGGPILFSGFGYDSWERLVLQVAHDDRAIFHAIVASGLLLEDMDTWPFLWPEPRKAPMNTQTAPALGYYQSATLQMAARAHDHDSMHLTAMISAVLFVCIETLYGDVPSAFNLIVSGSRLLSQCAPQCTASRYAGSIDILSLVYLRLETYMSELDRTTPHKLHDPLACVPIRATPSAFNSLQEASHHLEILANHCVCADENRGSGQYDAKRNYYRSLYQAWLDAFETGTFIQGGHLTARDRHLLSLLHIRRLDIYLALHGPDDNESQLLWDRHLPAFVEMLSHASSATESFRTRMSGAAHTIFVLGGGFILPLSRLARRCRDPFIRRAVVDILRDSIRRDGILEGKIAARVLERIIEIEEDGLGEVISCDQVPEMARLTDVLVRHVSGNERVMITYSRAVTSTGTRAWVEEELRGERSFRISADELSRE